MPCAGGMQTRHRVCKGPREMCGPETVEDKRPCNTQVCGKYAYVVLSTSTRIFYEIYSDDSIYEIVYIFCWNSQCETNLNVQ